MRRTRYEVLIDILKLCIEPKRKTQIVYKNNMNFNSCKAPLSYLIEKGWIKKVDNTYITTEIGNRNLNVLDPAMCLITACLT